MAAYTHKFTVLFKGVSPGGSKETYPIEEESKVEVEDKGMEINQFTEGDARVVKGEKIRPVIKSSQGKANITHTSDPVFRWEMYLNGVWIVIKKQITLKQLAIISEDLVSGLQANLKAAAYYSDATEAVSTNIAIEDFQTIINRSDVLSHLQPWTDFPLSGADDTAITAFEVAHPHPNK